MSKQLKPNFASQWLLIQIFGTILLITASQAFVTLTILLMRIDNLWLISSLRCLFYLASIVFQGYLQWHLLKQIVKSLDRQWMYTATIGLPINILTWALIHLGIKMFVFDEDGTVVVILAIVGAIGGAISGHFVGNWQKSLLKRSLYWRSLWHDWDRDHLLAGALSGICAAAILVAVVTLCGWNWLNSPLSGFGCSLGLAIFSQVMYSSIVGDTIRDVFEQAKLL